MIEPNSEFINELKKKVRKNLNSHKRLGLKPSADAAVNFIKSEGPFTLLNLVSIMEQFKLNIEDHGIEKSQYLLLQSQYQANIKGWEFIENNLNQNIKDTLNRYSQDLLSVMLSRKKIFSNGEQAERWIEHILKNPEAYGVLVTKEHLNAAEDSDKDKIDEILKSQKIRKKILDKLETTSNAKAAYEYLRTHKSLNLTDYFKIEKQFLPNSSITQKYLKAPDKFNTLNKNYQKEEEEWKKIENIFPNDYQNRYQYNLSNLLRLELKSSKCDSFAMSLATKLGSELRDEHLMILVNNRQPPAHQLIKHLCDTNPNLKNTQIYKRYAKNVEESFTQNIPWYKSLWGGTCGFFTGFLVGAFSGFGIMPIVQMTRKDEAGISPGAVASTSGFFSTVLIVAAAVFTATLALFPLGPAIIAVCGLFALAHGISCALKGADQGSKLGSGWEATKLAATIAMTHTNDVDKLIEDTHRDVTLRKLEQNLQTAPSRETKKSAESEIDASEIDLVSYKSSKLERHPKDAVDHQSRIPTLLTVETNDSPRPSNASPRRQSVTENLASDSRPSRSASIEGDDLPADLPIPPSPPAEFLVLGKLKQFDDHSKKHQKGYGNEHVEEEEEDEENDDPDSDEPRYGGF